MSLARSYHFLTLCVRVQNDTAICLQSTRRHACQFMTAIEPGGFWGHVRLRADHLQPRLGEGVDVR